MRICLCFLGLERTISKTYSNICSNIIDNTNTFAIVFVTWNNESSDTFHRLFPSAYIHKVKEISIEGDEFNNWKQGLQMHISWRRTYESDYALFRYFQQIYLWKKASEFLNTIKDQVDIIVRLRTDIAYSQPIYHFYKLIKDNKPSILFFPNDTQQHILREGESCPDQFFMGNPYSVLKALDISDFIHQYKINYIETKRKWFDVDTYEMNIIQPESTLYYYLKGSNIDIIKLPFTFNIER